MTALTRLRTTIEEAFDEFDQELREKERSILDTQNLVERIRKEKEQINRSLDETVSKFDELLNLLDKEHVVFPSKENLTESNYERILELSRVIYKESMLTLHLTRDQDLTENPKLKELRGTPEINKYIPIESLKRKVKAHFILAELYAALGVRTSPHLKDRSAIKEYEKVIDEGKILFKRLGREKDEFLENSLISIAYNLGASYKRLFDLFVEAEKKDDSKYGKVTKGERSVLHDYVKSSREWYNEMFDSAHRGDSILLNQVFHTEYEFKRYLHDINQLKLGCIFQRINSKDDSKEESAQYFQCSKKGEYCGFIPTKEDDSGCKTKIDDTCSYLKNTPYYGGLIVRIEDFIR